MLLRDVVKTNCILRVQGNILIETLVEFFSIFFFGLYVKHFSMNLPKLPSSCPKEHPEPIFQKSSKIFFRSFSEKVLAGVVKTTCVFNFSRAAISDKKNSENSKKSYKFPWNLSEYQKLVF